MKKRYIILIIIIVIYFLALFLPIGLKNIKKDKMEAAIIVGNDTVWELRHKKWYNVKYAADIKKLDWEEFKVLVSNEDYGNYYLWKDEKWYLFDKNKKSYNYSGELLAYKSAYPMKHKEYTINQISDYKYVNEVLKENGLKENQDFTVSAVNSVDFDNDGIVESFYFVSNAFPIDGYPEDIFSFVFMEKSGKLFNIYTSVEKNKNMNGCKPNLYSIIDVDEDDNYELIIRCGKYSIEKPIDMLYKFENNEFKIVISNQ